jgi:hypothetical protein
MFIVEGLPNKHISVPGQYILHAYLQGYDGPIVGYLSGQLSDPHFRGNFMVHIDPDICIDHLHEDPMPSNVTPSTTLSIYTIG